MIMKNLIIVLIAVFALSACSTSPVTDKIQSNITAYINANNSKIMDFMNDTTYLSFDKFFNGTDKESGFDTAIKSDTIIYFNKFNESKQDLTNTLYYEAATSYYNRPISNINTFILNKEFKVIAVEYFSSIKPFQRYIILDSIGYKEYQSLTEK